MSFGRTSVAAGSAFNTICAMQPYKTIPISSQHQLIEFIGLQMNGTCLNTFTTANTCTLLGNAASSSDNNKIQEEVLITGISNVLTGIPIIGPPQIILAGFLIKPPAASTTS